MSTLAEVKGGEFFLDEEDKWFHRQWDDFLFVGFAGVPIPKDYILCVSIPDGKVMRLSPETVVTIISIEGLLALALKAEESRRQLEHIHRIDHRSGEIRIQVSSR